MTEAWEPANDTERAMAKSLAVGDRQGYFRILGVAELYLPQFLDAAVDTDGQRFVTANLFGHTFLLVFTSLEGMLAQMNGVVDGYTMTNYPELRRKWPSQDWRLAVNPGVPIDAYVTIEAVEAAAVGDVSIPTAAEAILDAVAVEQDAHDATGAPPVEPQVEVDEALTAAAARGDSDTFLRTLLDAVVIMPTARPLADESELFEPDFPWRPAGAADAPTIEVFTSGGAYAQAYPQRGPSVTAALPFLLALWPKGYALSVNPGTSLAVQLSGDDVRTLLLWSEPMPDEP
jgi:hypothetical protein